MQEVPGQSANTSRYVYRGYVYHMDTTSVHLFRCATRSSTGCTGAACINDDQTVEVYNPHVGHQPNETILEELLMRREMLDTASQTNTPLKEIFDAVCRRHPIIAHKFVYPAMKSAMQRARNKVRPAIPDTLRDLATALDTYAPTESVYRGMVDGEDGSVALIFSSDQLLEALRSSTEIYVDGTFKVAPYHPRIVQLYTVHIRVMDTGIAAVYALCGARTRALYEAIFEKIAELAPGLSNSLRFIMGDYERAAMSALRAVFPEPSLHGCWFHFNQALERKWRNLGLAGVRTSILAMAMALPLAPHEVFDDGLALLANAADAIAADHPAVLQFMLYLRRQWSPLAEVVSVHGCPTRTNNLVESFHNEAKRKLGGLHPNIWKFIEYLVELIANQGVDLTRLQDGVRPRRARAIRNMARDTLIRDAQHALGVRRFTLAQLLERCATRTARARVVLVDALEDDAAEVIDLVGPGLLAAGEPRAEEPAVRRYIRGFRRNRRVPDPIVRPAAADAIAPPLPLPLPIILPYAGNEEDHPGDLEPVRPEPLLVQAEVLDEQYDENDFHIPEDDYEIFEMPAEPIPLLPVQRDVSTVNEDNGGVRSAGLCCICIVEVATHAFIPRGHRCCCITCATRIMDTQRCPLCRIEVTGVLHVIVDI